MPESPQPPAEVVLKGVAGSPGVALGPAYELISGEIEVPCYTIPTDQVEAELARLDQAVLTTRDQLEELRTQVAKRLGDDEAMIFDAHILVLEDRAILEETSREIRTRLLNADYCYRAVSDRFLQAFSAMEDAFLRERATDIRDITRRLLGNLTGGRSSHNLGDHLKEKVVIVANDLTPSETAELPRDKVLAIVNDLGGKTSHAVIMARSLEVPAVVGLHEATSRIAPGDTILVDGYEGLVIVHPSEATLFRYGKLRRQKEQLRAIYEAVVSEPSETADGQPFVLEANVDGPMDTAKAHRRGARSVGLFRTEHLFLKGDQFPTEEEQYEAYRAVVTSMKPGSVVIRTLDLGGDKQTDNPVLPADEDNPFMGFRALRLCLAHPDLFKAQLRAILRASAHGSVRIMYPMVSHLAEVKRANALLEECRRELAAKGIPFDPTIPVGAMVEIPGAALILDLLAGSCDFFSIGTNDLLQYLLAVDRGNERVASLYNPAHPGFLRLMRTILTEGKRLGRPVGICGELAGDPLFAPLLLAWGATSLSASPGALPELKFTLRRTTRAGMAKLAAEVEASTCSEDVRRALRAHRDTLAVNPDDLPKT